MVIGRGFVSRYWFNTLSKSLLNKAYKIVIFMSRGSILHGGPFELFLVSVCGMCCPVCGMVHIKEPLLLIENSPCSCGSGFPLSLSQWSFTILCPTPYNCIEMCRVLSLNKTFSSFLLSLAAKDPLYSPAHGHDSTYHGLVTFRLIVLEENSYICALP